MIQTAIRTVQKLERYAGCKVPSRTALVVAKKPEKSEGSLEGEKLALRQASRDLAEICDELAEVQIGWLSLESKSIKLPKSEAVD